MGWKTDLSSTRLQQTDISAPESSCFYRRDNITSWVILEKKDTLYLSNLACMHAYSNLTWIKSIYSIRWRWSPGNIRMFFIWFNFGSFNNYVDMLFSCSQKIKSPEVKNICVVITQNIIHQQIFEKIQFWISNNKDEGFIYIYLKKPSKLPQCTCFSFRPHLSIFSMGLHSCQHLYRCEDMIYISGN